MKTRRKPGRRQRIKIELAPLFQAAEELKMARTRSWLQIYLRRVYGLYLKWKDNGEAKRMSLLAAEMYNCPIRSGTHPLRYLIDITCAWQDRKVRSRWVRALQYAVHQKLDRRELRNLLQANGGVAGCARAMAKLRQRPQVRRRSENRLFWSRSTQQPNWATVLGGDKPSQRVSAPKETTQTDEMRS